MSKLSFHRRKLVRAVAASTLLATVVIGWPYLPEQTPQQDVSAIGDVDALKDLYQRWQDVYVQTGGDRRLALPLGYSKGLSAQFTEAAGQAAVDLIDGSLKVSVTGLEPQQQYQVWLIDNRPGAGQNVKPEQADTLLMVGELTHQDGIATLEMALDLAQLNGMELDLISVTRKGVSPVEAGLLYGAPTLFQRMYHSSRSATLALRQDSAPEALTESASPFSFLVPKAHAIPQNSAAFAKLVRDGEILFFEETFAGNGRTCGTCHPADNNFTIDPKFVASLPPNDPLFVAENNPALEDLEVPSLMRELGLILENVDGFENPGVMRGVPGVAAMAVSTTPEPGADNPTPMSRLGWGGDGAPGDGSLRSFAIGAVTQHAPQTLARIEGQDFRLPTEYELDAMEAFQMSLGLQQDLDLASMTMNEPLAEAGRQLFLNEDDQGNSVRAGKCHSCHADAGGNVSQGFLNVAGITPPGDYNLNLDIGFQDIGDTLGRILEPGLNPQDQGVGRDPHPSGVGFGTGAFNIPRLVEAADSGPYGHDNAFLTLESFLGFYFTPEFVTSPAAAIVQNIDGSIGPGGPFANTLNINNSEMSAIAAFLRVLNARENVRQAVQSMDNIYKVKRKASHKRAYNALLANIDDAIEVLDAAKLGPDAVLYLKKCRDEVARSKGKNKRRLRKAKQYAEFASGYLTEFKYR
ncbi:hypothetical protein [Marinobacterium jannaschii]|uniref:hypothetical protein n=1 Tax=Marinobacterium jannaschii TaxID=64970 RepID=UPI0006871E69|nr:hypothetical protein [Marinobacterium jannaschii]